MDINTDYMSGLYKDHPPQDTKPPAPAPPMVAVAAINVVVPVVPDVVVVEPNSLAATPAGLVTVTTTHPPVLTTAAQLPPNAVTISTTPPIADEVVIVGAGSSSDDDCFAPSSLDSLDTTHDYTCPEKTRGRRLDSSEVLILSPGAAGDSGVFDDSVNNGLNLDTSHVSVVTVGEPALAPSHSHTHIALNTRLSPDSFERRSQSDSGSVASSSSRAAHDADSLAAAADHEHNGGTRVNTEIQENGEAVVLRRKTQDGQPVNRIQRSKEDIHMANLKKKTRKRTRKFEIDGVIVTTTTSKVIWGDEESGRTWDDHALRKQELREIKMLQKQEQKQFQDLDAKETQLREQQDKRFEAELASLARAHEADLDTLARAQRAAAERAEQQLETELRHAGKRLRAEHERDLRHFRDTLKQELRLLKQEREMIAKVYHFLSQEYKFMKLHNYDNCDLSPLGNITRRTAEATGVGEKTVSRVLQEQRNMPSTSAKYSGPKTRKTQSKKDSKIDLKNYSVEVIREAIESYHKKHKEIPSLPKLKTVLKDLDIPQETEIVMIKTEKLVSEDDASIKKEEHTEYS